MTLCCILRAESFFVERMMDMERKVVLDIRIEANGPALHMKGENAEIDMIPFRGTVSGELFSGSVEPCGVDTQIVNAVAVRHMSARYITDSANIS